MNSPRKCNVTGKRDVEQINEKMRAETDVCSQTVTEEKRRKKELCN